MSFTYPHTIENGGGERLTFLRRVPDPAGDWLEVENLVQPNAGPPMHVHFKQDEGLTVVRGKLGIQRSGGEPEYYEPGASVTFLAGQAHRFWNAGTEPLICKGWIKPAHNVEFFLTEIYRSAAANGGKEPKQFDGAWLLSTYKTEFDITDIPSFVRKVIFPVTVFMGKLMGRHRKFRNAPAPVR